MKDTEYKCYGCGGVFVKGWSDKEEAEECQRLWGIKPDNPAGAKVCDDCYKEFMEWFKKNYES